MRALDAISTLITNDGIIGAEARMVKWAGTSSSLSKEHKQTGGGKCPRHASSLKGDKDVPGARLGAAGCGWVRRWRAINDPARVSLKIEADNYMNRDCHNRSMILVRSAYEALGGKAAGNMTSPVPEWHCA